MRGSRSHSIRLMLITASLLSVMGMAVPSASAQEAQPVTAWWTNFSGGSFQDGDNWTPRAPLLAQDNAVFNLDNTYTVTFASDVTNGQMTVLGGNVTLDLLPDDGVIRTYTLTYNSPGVLLDSGTALTLTGGTVQVNSSTVVGQLIHESASLTVTGAQSKWNSDLVVGSIGHGELFALDHAVVGSTSAIVGDAASDVGTATIDGGATWTGMSAFTIGNAGNGTLHVSNAGTTYSSILKVGNAADAVGLVTVDGEGSKIETGTGSVPLMNVGVSGHGELHITNGGTADIDGAILGAQAGGSGGVSVDGDDSTWINHGKVYVGDYGHGELTIQNGGAVTNSDAYIANHSIAAGTGTGSAVIHGARSTWNNTGILAVGESGNGMLTVSNGGAVTSAEGVIGDRAGLEDVGDNNLAAFVSHGQAAIDGDGSTWNNLGNLYVGNQGHGELTLTNGGHVSNGQGYIGYNATDVTSIGDDSGTGVVTVDGKGSTWTNAAQLVIAEFGNGTLHITSGGAVTSNQGHIGDSAGSHGTVLIDGASPNLTPSSWTSIGQLIIGNQGHGELTIKNGGHVSNGQGYIANHVWDEDDGIGIVTVTGQGSAWTNTVNLHVGEFGRGILNVTSGGAVLSDEGYIGDSAGSIGIATVDGDGSSWTNSGQLVVGNFDDGNLTVSHGGTVSSSVGVLAAHSEADSFVYIRDTDSSWVVTGDMYVGGSASGGGGSGSLNISSGAVLDVGGTLTNYASTGYVGLTAATLHATRTNNAGNLFVTAGDSDIYGQLNNTSYVTVDNGATATFHGDVVQNGTFRVNQAVDTFTVGTAIFRGKFSGTGGIVGGGDVYFQGDLTPGNSPAPVTFDADVFLTDDTHTVIELAGASEDNHQFDRIIVNGELTLDGTLDVILLDDFVPELSEVFDILDWTALAGTFDAVHLPTLNAGLMWDRTKLYTTGELRVVPEPTAVVFIAWVGPMLLARRRRRPEKRSA